MIVGCFISKKSQKIIKDFDLMADNLMWSAMFCFYCSIKQAIPAKQDILNRHQRR